MIKLLHRTASRAFSTDINSFAQTYIPLGHVGKMTLKFRVFRVPWLWGSVCSNVSTMRQNPASNRLLISIGWGHSIKNDIWWISFSTSCVTEKDVGGHTVWIGKRSCPDKTTTSQMTVHIVLKKNRIQGVYCVLFVKYLTLNLFPLAFWIFLSHRS